MTFHPASLGYVLVSLTLAPVLPGLIQKIKAVFAGRTGQPITQVYSDLWKLLKKGAVYSRTTTWVFRVSPVVTLSAVALAVLLVPWSAQPACLAFPGDFILVAYLLGLGRFAMMVGALDTGSSFEGMGASREAMFSALAEPVLFLVLAGLVRHTGSLSLSGGFGSLAGERSSSSIPELLLLSLAFSVVLLVENARVPIDDPNTHLELTMIHEVMILDHSGPDLACFLYASTLKLWLFSSIMAGMLLSPLAGGTPVHLVLFVPTVLALAVGVGIVESVMARLRLVAVPQVLIGAGALAALALILMLR